MNTFRIIVILGLVLVGTIATADTYSNIMIINSKIAPNRAAELAIYIDKAAVKHRLPAGLLVAIIAQESMFQVDAVNKVSKDYGIMQINIRTIQAYKFDKQRLLSDAEYSIDSGAMVLAWFKRYQTAESNWYCRYNVGTAKLTIQNINRCLKYVTDVQQYQFQTIASF